MPNSEIRDAGQEGTKEWITKAAQEIYDAAGFTNWSAFRSDNIKMVAEVIARNVPVSAPTNEQCEGSRTVNCHFPAGHEGDCSWEIPMKKPIPVPSPPKNPCRLCKLSHKNKVHNNKSLFAYHEFVTAPVPEPEPASNWALCKKCGHNLNLCTCEPPARKDELCATCGFKVSVSHQSCPCCLKPWKGISDQLVIDLARELYDRFVMGGWKPEDAHPQIWEMLAASVTPVAPQASPEAPAKEDEREWEAFKAFLTEHEQKNDDVPAVLAWRAWKARARLGLSGRAE